MANRILRDWTDSEKVDTLTFHAEVLFIRLFMKADDFGCFHANPKLVNAALFPLKNIRESDISRWMDECQNSGLIAFYYDNGKKYLTINNFGQRLRTMKRRFPEPKEIETPQTIVSDLRTIDGLKRNETETKQKQESETEITATPERIFFKIRDLIIYEKVSDYHRNNFVTFREQFEMKFGSDLTEEVFERMDAEYTCYAFNNENHLQNTFKSLYEKIKKEKSSGQKETKYQSLIKANKAAHDLIDAKYANRDNSDRA